MNFNGKNKMNLFLWFKSATRDFFDYAGQIINFVLLSLVYVFGVSLTFLLSKILKKRFLDLKVDQKIKSYYQDFNQESAENYFKQF